MKLNIAFSTPQSYHPNELIFYLECDSVSYEFSLSNSDFPTSNLFDLFKNDEKIIEKYFDNEDITYEKFKQRALSINIYYPQFTYTVINELQKITIIDLFSNIGGTLGLFLGKIIAFIVGLIFMLFF